MTTYESCNGCGRGPLLWADGVLICPRPFCAGHKPEDSRFFRGVFTRSPSNLAVRKTTDSAQMRLDRAA